MPGAGWGAATALPGCTRCPPRVLPRDGAVSLSLLPHQSQMVPQASPIDALRSLDGTPLLLWGRQRQGWGSWSPVVSQAWNWGHEDLWGRGSEEGKRLLAPIEPQEEAAPSPGCPAELSSEGEFAPDPGEPWPPSPAQNLLQPRQVPTGYSCTARL